MPVKFEYIVQDYTKHKEHRAIVDSIVNKLKISFQKGIVGKVARLKKGRIVNDTSQDEDYIVDIIPKYSEITVPIIVNNKLIGILDSEHPEKNYYKKFQLEFLQQICAMIGLRLEKAVLELEKDIKQEELDKTNLRFDKIFNNDNNAEVIESAKGVIIEVGDSFLDLFGVPRSQKSHFEGMKCHDARENLKEMFLYPEKWCQDSTSQNSGRLDHHPAIGQEFTFEWRAHHAAKRSRMGHHHGFGNFPEQKENSHALPQPCGVGSRYFWCRSCRTTLFSKASGQAQCVGSCTLGGHVASSALF